MTTFISPEGILHFNETRSSHLLVELAKQSSFAVHLQEQLSAAVPPQTTCTALESRMRTAHSRGFQSSQIHTSVRTVGTLQHLALGHYYRPQQWDSDVPRQRMSPKSSCSKFMSPLFPWLLVKHGLPYMNKLLIICLLELENFSSTYISLQGCLEISMTCHKKNPVNKNTSAKQWATSILLALLSASHSQIPRFLFTL